MQNLVTDRSKDLSVVAPASSLVSRHADAGDEERRPICFPVQAGQSGPEPVQFFSLVASDAVRRRRLGELQHLQIRAQRIIGQPGALSQRTPPGRGECAHGLHEVFRTNIGTVNAIMIDRPHGHVLGWVEQPCEITAWW